MGTVNLEVDRTKQIVENLVTANKYEISLIESVNENISSLDSTFEEYESIKKTLGIMIEQSNISKEDIEKMLVVYQDNIEKTGESVSRERRNDPHSMINRSLKYRAPITPRRKIAL
jgi:hypothetical protein